MRILTVSKLLVLGGTAVWAARRLLRPRSKPAPDLDEDAARADFVPDPDDPVQNLDEAGGNLSELDLDALDAADAQAAQDMALLESELDALDTPPQTTIDAQDVSVDETGELYGVYPRVLDEGQNWIEALETSAAEYGTEPEQELDIIDDIDTAPHPSDTRDTPVADRGSGGPAGV